MIKANELRIGNYYQGASRGGYEVATGRTIAQLEEGKLNALPIPLTQELMDKQEGWERLPQDNGPIVYRKKISPVGKYLNLSIGNEIVWVIEEQLEALGNPIGQRQLILLPYHPKALHQLQNLYFSLTGTELDITL